ncbi:hypothetical protein B0F90DRAFT_1100153 [Multifurca ochricompacta]|uniref:Uncharacterized protein n=1 Tax=Multifurca ochricompacta TaxID=376703 RepID=A0AAD4M8F6_9AGAM|nr:hypothetical protein B0F90DRAFT_1100153 [Multifurca ochricompacta]
MLRSTVTTGSYILEKYSRSYPSPASAQTQSQDPTVGQLEWQHFTNPVMALTLDVKKSMDNQFESVRLRISWNMNMGHDRMKREIIMEDLDLLSFSRIDSQIHSGQGQPLKAVYRGAVVGIRYQYPLSVPATSPTVNFTSASDAAQFIDAIRPVCPCKENAGPPAPQILTNRCPVPTPIQALPICTSLVPYDTGTTQRPSMPPPSVTTTGPIENIHNRRKEESCQRASYILPPSSSDLSLAPSSDPAPPNPNSSISDRSPRSSSVRPEMHSTTLAPQATPPTATHEAHEAQKTREAFLGSLRQVPELYGLTRPELENLVSVVVREPGFPRLLEALNSMWVIRGFLGQ